MAISNIFDLNYESIIAGIRLIGWRLSSMDRRINKSCFTRHRNLRAHAASSRNGSYCVALLSKPHFQGAMIGNIFQLRRTGAKKRAWMVASAAQMAGSFPVSEGGKPIGDALLLCKGCVEAFGKSGQGKVCVAHQHPRVAMAAESLQVQE